MVVQRWYNGGAAAVITFVVDVVVAVVFAVVDVVVVAVVDVCHWQ